MLQKRKKILSFQYQSSVKKCKEKITMHKRGKRNLLFCVLILILDVLPMQLIGQSQKYDNSKSRVTKILKTADGNCRVLENNFPNDDGISNESLSTISIIGDFGTGKSFLLNFVLAYLKRGDVAFEEKSTFEKTFSIEKTIDSETSGIDMYNGYLPHPEGGGQIALMDTEGISDPGKSQKHASSVFAVSAYFSSVLIYNIKEKFTTTNIDRIQVFLRDMRQINKGKRKYFQDLIIVFRDFPVRSFGFGIKGGKEYMKYMFETVSANDFSKTFLRELQNSFKSVHLYLMPQPSKNVTQRETPMETVGGMADSDFVKCIKELSVWIGKKFLVQRKFKTGQKLTVGNFKENFSKFSSKIQKIENGNMAYSVAKFLKEEDINKTLKEVFEHYQKELYKQWGFFMTKEKRQQVHKNLKQNATAQFKREMGKLFIEKEFVEKTKVYLKLMIDQQFEVFNNSTVLSHKIALFTIVGVVIVGGAVAVKVYIPVVGFILLREAKPFIVEGLKNAPNYIKL